MNLLSIASSFPSQRLEQQECWRRLEASPALGKLRPASVQFLKKMLHNANGIDSRHLALADMHFLSLAAPHELNRGFEREGTHLASEASRKAMEAAGCEADQVDALMVCTCTGYLCPGLSSHVAGQLGLRDDVALFDLVGQGCGAAIPLLHAAYGHLTAYPNHRVLCIAVEISSAAFYLDDDPGVLVSLALFGDAASATLWTGGEISGAWQASGFQSLHLPEQRETLRFVNQDGYLKNKLHRDVPRIVSEAVGRLYRNLGSQPPEHVLSHGGGRDVLDAVEMALPGYELKEAREILRRYGNTSSPSVLLALEQHLADPEARSDLWLTSFGAGVTCHGMRLQRN
ncbi:MAG: type III polyketide synthase [Candidatus Methylacidiphilales bacterium]